AARDRDRRADARGRRRADGRRVAVRHAAGDRRWPAPVGRAPEALAVVAEPEQAAHHHHRSVAKRSLGSPALFAIVYTSVAAAIYFSLGVVADHALGMTPFVFLVAGVMFVLAAMTYVEGSSLHQARGGSTVFARYAFNEFWSFFAGWAILLDYTILLAVTAFSATN